MIPIYEDSSSPTVTKANILKAISPLTSELRYCVFEFKPEYIESKTVREFTDFTDTELRVYKIPKTSYGIVYSFTEQHTVIDNIVKNYAKTQYMFNIEEVYVYINASWVLDVTDLIRPIKNNEGLKDAVDIVHSKVFEYYKTANSYTVYKNLFSNVFRLDVVEDSDKFVANIPKDRYDDVMEILHTYFEQTFQNYTLKVAPEVQILLRNFNQLYTLGIARFLDCSDGTLIEGCQF